ncbi:unnamed protein product [Coregonus sp. 'balchen']|nr:unnamed protein product [Coregonus sp. 'balchen']
MARMNRPAPAEVCYKNMRLLITHNPTNSTLNSFIEDLKKYGATTVVRVCEVTYDKAPLEKDGITVVINRPWIQTTVADTVTVDQQALGPDYCG